MKSWAYLALSLVLIFSSGCQSEPKQATMMLPDRDNESKAEGSAYAADSMHYSIPMPSHPDWRPTEFYFKHCSDIGEHSFYSKTSYQCSQP